MESCKLFLVVYFPLHGIPLRPYVPIESKRFNPFTPRVKPLVNKCGSITCESVDETLVCDHSN